MDRTKQLEYCKKCTKQAFDLKQGIICSLTNQKADFVSLKRSRFNTVNYTGSGTTPCENNTISECIDNTILALRDARAATVTALDLGGMKIRVDVIAPNDRRVMATYTELNPREEGIILLSQNL